MERFIRTFKLPLVVVGAMALMAALAMPLLNSSSSRVAPAAAQEEQEPLDEPAESDELEGEPRDEFEGEPEDTGELEEGGGLEEGTEPDGGVEGVQDLGGVDNVTFDLRLESASIDRIDLDDNDLEFVRYRFAGIVDEINDENGLQLRGLDSDEQVRAETAFRDEGDLNSVIAGFPADTDLPAYTLAVVQAEAVENINGEGNVPDTAALDGSTISLENGRTDGPDLVDVVAQPNLERVDFVFDENLEEEGSEAAANANNLGYYALDGTIHNADEIVSVEDNVLTARFDEDQGDQVEEAVRWFILSDTVEDRSGNANVLGAIGGQTTAPDLIAVNEAVGDTQWDYVFDQDITDADLSKFLAYTADGTRYQAESMARPDSATVRAAFSQVQKFGQDIILAAVEPGAVKRDKGFDTQSTAGAAATSDSGELEESGSTTGPDLQSVDVDRNSGQATMHFDELVNDDKAWDPSNFFVVTDSGRLVPGAHYVETDDNRVIVTWDPTSMQAARGIVIEDGAVEDFQGNPNPMDMMEI